MTRRFPDLPTKQLVKDAKIATKLIRAWDVEKDQNKVFQIYLKEKEQLSDQRYWELMRTVWIVSGSNDNADVFRSLMSSKRKFKRWFMTPEESAFLSVLSMPLTVYRAHNDGERFTGLSWTLSIEYARQYQRMYGKSEITQRNVNSDHIFAYTNRNNEQEIIII